MPARVLRPIRVRTQTYASARSLRRVTCIEADVTRASLEALCELRGEEHHDAGAGDRF